MVCLLLIIILGTLSFAQPASAANLEPLQTTAEGSTIYLPYVSRPDEASLRIQVPAGFNIRIYAQDLTGRPRFMAIGPDGHLYISLFSSGQIARLPDRDNDGRADGVEVIASGLSLPHGIEFRDDWLYVACSDRVVRLAGPDESGSFGTPELITNNIPGPPGHSTRTLHFGPDGKMYVSVGSSCNICEETDPRRAAILRFNPDGSIPGDNPFFNDLDPNKHPVYAYGLRNSVDFLWSPTGELWADHNGSDLLGDDLPPEEIVIQVQKGASHGWPYCYTPTLGINTANEVRDVRLDLPGGFSCDQAVPARFTAPAHSAPLGMALGADSNFPPEYRSSLYVAFHGSWNTSNSENYRDCKVERVILENGQPVGSQTFATGWRVPGTTCGASTTWGRPADVIFAPDGAMFISDDKGYRVYKVTYQP